MTIATGLPVEARRPAAAVAVAALGLLVLVGAAAMLVGEAFDRSAELERTREGLAALVARSRDVGPRTARVEKLFAGDPYLVGTSDVLATNGLQRHVAALAAECRVVVRSIGREARHEDDVRGTASIALRLEADASTADVQRFLYRLETESPFLLIDSLTLRPATAGADDDRLAADLVVVGFRRRAES